MSPRGRDNQGARSLHCRGYDIERIGEKELRAIFATFGKVVDVYLPRDFYTKQLRGFAYIQFEKDEEADQARQKLDRTDVFEDNHTVNIMWAVGDRKTPNDMRRLDIVRDNPHARRERERQRELDRERMGRHDRDFDRDWDRRRWDRDRWDRPRPDEPSWGRNRWGRERHRGRDRDRDRYEDLDRDRDRHRDRDRYRDRHRLDDRERHRPDERADWDRHRIDDRDRDRYRVDDRERYADRDRDRDRARHSDRERDRSDDMYRESGRGHDGFPGRHHSRSPPRSRPREDDPRDRGDMYRPRDDTGDRERDRERDRDHDLQGDPSRKRARSRSPSAERGRDDFDKRRRRHSRSRSPDRGRSASPRSYGQDRGRDLERDRYDDRGRDRGSGYGEQRTAASRDADHETYENGRDSNAGLDAPGPANGVTEDRSNAKGDIWPRSQPALEKSTRDSDISVDNGPKLRSVAAPKLRSAPLSPAETTPESR